MTKSATNTVTRNKTARKSRKELDEYDKIFAVELVRRGCSRRVAARYLNCAHTTIGRTAARDQEFANELALAETGVHLEAVHLVRKAAREPKYWRAAAWILERRDPEDYARRDPNSFTADQVMTLVSGLCADALAIAPKDKVEELQQLFDDAMDEVEAKSGGAGRKQEIAEDEEEASPAPLPAAPSFNQRPAAKEVVAKAAASVQPHLEQPQTAAAPTESEREEAKRVVAEEARKLILKGRRGRRKATGQGASERFNIRRLHQPHLQRPEASSKTPLPKVFAANGFEHTNADSTTTDKIEGRCNGHVHPPEEMAVLRQ